MSLELGACSQHLATIASPQITTNGYAYQPLPTNGSFIRVLRFRKRPYISNGPLRARVEFVDIARKETSRSEYYAISYAWGEVSGSASIYLDDQELVITRSADAALRGILSHINGDFRYRAYPVWIDAVCINQADVVKKQKQIVLMGQLFASAKIVLAWLGQGSGMTEAEFRNVNIFIQLDDDENEDVEPQWLPLGIDVDAVRSLLSCSWLSRLWCVQEVALSREALVVRGSYMVAWASFAHAVRMLCSRTHLLWLDLEHKILRAMVFQGATWLRSRVSVLGLLYASLLLEASNPWDNVYGLLGCITYGTTEAGVVNGDDITPIIPDYQEPLVEVYRQATWLSLQKDGTKIIFVGQLWVPLPDNLLGSWPSWVPRYHEACSAEMNLAGLRHSNVVKAGEPHTEMDSNRCIIRVKGVCIRIVTGIHTRRLSNKEDLKDLSAALWNFDRTWTLTDLSDLAWALFSRSYRNRERRVYTNEELLLNFGNWLLELQDRSRVVKSNLEDVILESESAQGSADCFSWGLWYNESHALVELDDGSFARARDFVQWGDQVCQIFGTESPVMMCPQGTHYKLRGTIFIPRFTECIEELQSSGQLDSQAQMFSIS